MMQLTVHSSRLTNRWGFTLLELIITFTILGLILLIIGSGLRLGVKAWERGERLVDEAQRVRILYERFFSEVRSAYPYFIGEGEERRILFDGRSDSLSFVTSRVDVDGLGGLKWVSYFIEDGALTVEEKRIPDKELDEIDGKKAILEPRITRLIFEYYDREEEEWNMTWDSEEKGRLPEAIKVDLTLKDGGKLFPPFLISIPASYSPEEGK